MDKKVFLAVVLCAGIYFVWYQMYSKQFVRRPVGQTQMTLEQSPAAVPQALPTITTRSEAIGSSQNKFQVASLENTSLDISISTHGGVAQTVRLKDYKGHNTNHVQWLVGDGEQLQLSTPSQEWAYLSSVNYSLKEERDLNGKTTRVLLSYQDPNIFIERTYSLNNSSPFSFDHQITAKFKKQPPSYLFVNLQVLKNIPKQENERRDILFNKSGGQTKWGISDVDEAKEDLGQGHWFGFASRYFLSALVNRDERLSPQFQAHLATDNQVSANLVYRIVEPSIQIPLTMYYGPKEVEALKVVGSHLDAAVDFGWFTFFAYPLLQALKWFYKYVHNYGIAIILLTIFVKILTYPLTYKSMKSMKEMQRIQPQLQKLREKYKDDKEKLNREMLQLMRANGYNPASGCFPMLIQMPVFIALYNVLYGAIDLYGQPFFGWIHDLSAKDPFFVTPILLSLMMFLQQKLTPNTAADPAQQKVMMFMPVMFGFMMLWLPSGLTLYMLVNSVTSVLQQLLMNKHLNIGGNTTKAVVVS